MAHLGMRLVEVAPERVVGELEIGEHLKTTTGAVHGGTLMAFADTIGAVGTSAMGLKTATLESKTKDRKSTRLNSSHSQISYAVFCLKKKKNTIQVVRTSHSTYMMISHQHQS